MQLPMGVFGVAIATTTLTEMSHDAAASDWHLLRGNLQRGLRMVLFLTVPSTVGLALLGVPIIRLIYEHGRFSHHATVETARALSGYAIGLVAYAAIKVEASAFYALKRARVPMVASVSAVGANLVWNALTFRRFGHVGLAVGTSIAALVNAGVLVFAFQKLIGGFITRELLLPFLKILVAAAVMAAAVWLASARVEALPAAGTVGAAIKVFVPIAVGIGVYFGAAKILRLQEANTLLKRFR
jgi:putative peptidoglycan lipid II flippase